MEVFNQLQRASQLKKLVSFGALDRGEYPVHAFELVDAKYGQTLKADLGDQYVFLPKRFADDLTEEKVKALNTIPQIMVYEGKDLLRNG